VTDAVVVKLDASCDARSIAKGYGAHCAAIGSYSDHTRHDVTGSVIWTSEKPEVAKISVASGVARLDRQGLPPGQDEGRGDVHGLTTTLECAESTVELHVTALLRKTHCNGRAALVARYWTDV
jgi:hypothetical protein